MRLRHIGSARRFFAQGLLQTRRSPCKATASVPGNRMAGGPPALQLVPCLPPAAAAAAEDSSQDSANELPTDLAAGSAHRAFSHRSRN
jgi:hypothetical protein